MPFKIEYQQIKEDVEFDELILEERPGRAWNLFYPETDIISPLNFLKFRKE